MATLQPEENEFGMVQRLHKPNRVLKRRLVIAYVRKRPTVGPHVFSEFVVWAHSRLKGLKIRSMLTGAGQRILARRSAYHGFPVSISPRRSAYFQPIGLRTANHVNFYLAFISSRVGKLSRAALLTWRRSSN